MEQRSMLDRIGHHIAGWIAGVTAMAGLSLSDPAASAAIVAAFGVAANAFASLLVTTIKRLGNPVIEAAAAFVDMKRREWSLRYHTAARVAVSPEVLGDGKDEGSDDSDETSRVRGIATGGKSGGNGAA